MSNLQPIKPAMYLLPQEGEMRVPGLVVATPSLISAGEIEKPLDQVRRVATLPGIVGYSIAMPDIHWGYGFPIGGVAAMQLDTGVISPGGVGYDINCGVRLAVVPLAFKEIERKTRRALLERIFHLIPSGVGHGHKHRRSLSEQDYRQLIEQGAAWSVERGEGLPLDLDHTESYGKIKNAHFEAISDEAMRRGRDQLGTVGSGNHFIEIGEIAHLFRPDIAHAWGVQAGQTYVLIHSGSRGFGHQVCQDALNRLLAEGYATGLADRQLVAAPIQSSAGQHYLSAMAAAANYAFNNRQQLLHGVREAFLQVCGIPHEQILLVYDVCHNIAKIEQHSVNGSPRSLCVHRKGATRAFGPGHPELAPLFRQTGQPVLVPGDMGRASHLMVGLGNPMTWCSACHGAGRAHSRHQSMKQWGGGREAIQHMAQQGVEVMACSTRTIAEEMPDAYKDVDEVVEAVEQAGLANRVARLRPALVLKG